MAKTLNQFIESYLKVKSADEQKFVDKHVTAKVADRNGNGDDVFKGNTKTIDRRKDRKGYNPGEDEKVYEAADHQEYYVNMRGQSKPEGATYNHKTVKVMASSSDHAKKLAKQQFPHDKATFQGFSDVGTTSKLRNEELKGSQHKIDANKNGKIDAHDFKLLRGKKKKVAEEAEQVDEKLDMKKASMGTVVKDFQKSDAPQFQGKSASKRRVMAIAAKLTAERGGKPLNKEERLQDRLSDISESHQRVMLEVFEKLSEDNQSKFMTACATPEGVEQMLDFAITYRGE